MAMGRAHKEQQGALRVETDALPRTPGRPFYEKVAELLARHGFEAMVEGKCASVMRKGLGVQLLPAIPKGGREETPSAAIIDGQSVKTTERGDFADMTRSRNKRAQTPPDC